MTMGGEPSSSILDRTTVANALWLSGERVGALAVQFVAGVLVVRHLGPDRYGLLSWSMSLVWLVVPIVGMGLDHMVRRDWALLPPDERPELVRRVMMLRGAVSIAGFLVVLIIAASLAPEGIAGLTVLLSVGVLAQPLSTSAVPFEVELTSRVPARARFLAIGIVAMAQVGGVILDAALWWFYVAALVGLTGPPLATWATYRRSFTPPNRRRRHQGVATVKLLRGASPFFVAAVAGAVSMRVDQIMLEAMQSARAVGTYAAAVRISEVPYFLPVVVAASLFGATARGNQERRLHRMTATFDVLTALAVILAVTLVVVAEPLVGVVLGGEYMSSVPVLRMHALGLIALSWNVARWQVLVIEGRQVLAATAAASGAVVNVAANLLLIPAYGPMGAAMATVLSYFFESVGIGFLLVGLRPTSRMMVRSLVRLPRTAPQIFRDIVRMVR